MLRRPPTGALGPLNEKLVADAVLARRETTEHNRDALAAQLPQLSLLDFVRALVHACTQGNEPCDDTIVEGNVRALRQRSRAGVAKYGHTLDRDDLLTTDWIEHLKQELLDGANYAERLLCDLSRVEAQWSNYERKRIAMLARRHWAKFPRGSESSLALMALIEEIEQGQPGAGG